MSDFWSVVIMIMIFVFIIWYMIKQDQTDNSCDDVTFSMDYRRLAPLQKYKMVMRKIYELQQRNLIPSRSNVSLIRGRIRQLQDVIHMKEEFLYHDELMQCSNAIKWLEESNEYREMFSPPYIEKVPYTTLTDSDVEDALKLMSEPIDMRKSLDELMNQPVTTTGSGNTKPSLPVVDKWATRAVCYLTEFLNFIWNLVEYIIWNLFHDKCLQDFLNIVQGYIVVNVKMQKEKTTIIVDFMVPRKLTEINETMSESLSSDIPYAVPIGPSWKPLQGICCTSVEYVKPDTSAPPQDSQGNNNY